jgi:hypothetical protein
MQAGFEKGKEFPPNGVDLFLASDAGMILYTFVY